MTQPADGRRPCHLRSPFKLVIVSGIVLVVLATFRGSLQRVQLFQVVQPTGNSRYKISTASKVTPTSKRVDGTYRHKQSKGKERQQFSNLINESARDKHRGDKTHVVLPTDDVVEQREEEKPKHAVNAREQAMDKHRGYKRITASKKTYGVVRQSKNARGSVKRYPRIAILKASTGDKKKVNTTSIMSSRVGIELADTYIGDKLYGNYSTTGVSENITERYIPPPILSKGCVVPIHAQPSCNNIHSLDLASSLRHDLFRKISKGDVRNVWSVLQTHKRRRVHILWEEQRVSFVIKTLRWARDFLRQTFVLQQKEAVALDFLSHTPGITTIYGFCGVTSLNSYANQGNLADFLKRRLRASKNVSPAEFLAISARLARSVAGMQTRESSILGSGYKRNASLRVIHRDIGASNCLLSQGKTRLEVRLDDFNKAHVIRRYERSSSSKNRMCTYQERYICGEDGRRPDTRSPEECRGNQSLTYKVDTYGLGTVFFFLLTQNRVHNLNSDAPGPADEHIEWYRERVKEGEEPEIPHTIVSMSNQAVIAIINGMKMAMTPDPRKRPSATEIADYLDDEYWKYVDASMKNSTVWVSRKTQEKLGL